MKKLIFIIILSTVCLAQNQTVDKETLKKINQSVILSYNNQKMDDALKLAKQAVDLSVKIYGTENQETATAYTNLGVIYREKKKYKESVESLQSAVDIYQKTPDAKNQNLVETYEVLALSQLLAGMKVEAEANYLKAVASAENKFGRENKEVFSPTLYLANYYTRTGQFEKADELYLKTYALAIKNFGREAKAIQQIEDSRSCLEGQIFNVEKEKIFSENKEKLFGMITERGSSITGKAKFLPKPAYPAEARMQRLSGKALIRVLIDEQGNVVETKSICRDDILAKAAIESARNAKFSPVVIDGKPTKISGILIYTFIAP